MSTTESKVERPVRAERSGWRDHALSERHRQWGWNCPAADIDFLLAEYDRGKASALVEYKHEDAPLLRSWHPSILVLVDLADRAGVPVFVVRYAADFSWWYVQPLNQCAKEWLPQPEKLTEKGWVKLLHRIRGHAMPEGLFDDGDNDEVI